MLDFDKDSSSNCEQRDFMHRTADPKDQDRIDEIIAYMAARGGSKFLTWGSKDFAWKKGSTSDLERDKYTKVGEQFINGDYNIFYDALVVVD